jgi:hypothetical protein
MGSPGQDWTTERGERHRGAIRCTHETKSQPAKNFTGWLFI